MAHQGAPAMTNLEYDACRRDYGGDGAILRLGLNGIINYDLVSQAQRIAALLEDETTRQGLSKCCKSVGILANLIAATLQSSQSPPNIQILGNT